MRNLVRHWEIAACTLLLAAGSYGQSANFTNPPDSAPAATNSNSERGDSGRFGIGVKASLLGGGVEAAARVTHRTNLRGGFNMFSYSRGFNKDGVAYNGQLSFKTVEAHYDFSPFAGSFRVSPGVLIYAGTPITANASIPGGGSFTLGGVPYISDPSAPVTGNGTIKFNRAAPMATFGWGNLVPRKQSKHFSIPVELGVAFQGSPTAALSFAGSVCDPNPLGGPPVNCRTVASDSQVQAHVVDEQNKINHSMRFFKVYPIISVGFGYKF
jgi:hypothetical protein